MHGCLHLLHTVKMLSVKKEYTSIIIKKYIKCHYHLCWQLAPFLFWWVEGKWWSHLSSQKCWQHTLYGNLLYSAILLDHSVLLSQHCSTLPINLSSTHTQNNINQTCASCWSTNLESAKKIQCLNMIKKPFRQDRTRRGIRGRRRRTQESWHKSNMRVHRALS